jgi:hypothetical protein
LAQLGARLPQLHVRSLILKKLSKFTIFRYFDASCDDDAESVNGFKVDDSVENFATNRVAAVACHYLLSCFRYSPSKFFTFRKNAKFE